MCESFYNIKVNIKDVEDRFTYVFIHNLLSGNTQFKQIMSYYKTVIEEVSAQLQTLLEKVLVSDESTRILEYNLLKFLTFKDKGSNLYRQQLTKLFYSKENTLMVYQLIQLSKY